MCVRYRYPVPTSIPRSHAPTYGPPQKCWADRHAAARRRGGEGRAGARRALLRGSAKSWLNLGGLRKDLVTVVAFALGLPSDFFVGLTALPCFAQSSDEFFFLWSHHPPKCPIRPGFWSCCACRLCQTQDILPKRCTSWIFAHLDVTLVPVTGCRCAHTMTRATGGPSGPEGPSQPVRYRALTLW